MEHTSSYWQADSAAAWDKCEERRIENERLRAALGAVERYPDIREYIGTQVHDLVRAALSDKGDTDA